MKRIRLPKSVRKHIRLEKARMRREVLEPQKQQEFIAKLYARFALQKQS